MSAPFQRPEHNEYYMRLAFAVRERANCKGSRVGAVLVLEDRVISTGYNGTPQGMPNCEDDDGCVRCAKRENFGSGNAYDVCICVCIEVQGAEVYTTMAPCFGCAKGMLQAHVEKVYFLHDWVPTDPELAKQYAMIVERLRVERIDIEDQNAAWARGGKRAA